MARGRRNNRSDPNLPSRMNGAPPSDDTGKEPEQADGNTGTARPFGERPDDETIAQVEAVGAGPETGPGLPAVLQQDDAPVATKDRSMSEPDETRETAGGAAAAPTEPRPAARPRRGGWLAGFIGGLLGSAALIGGAGWYAYTHGPVRPALERFQAAEDSARTAAARVEALEGRLAELQGALERTGPALAALDERLGAAEQARSELGTAVEQLDARLESTSQATGTRIEELATKLVQVEQAQPADVVDKKTVADLAAAQAGLNERQVRLEGTLARLEGLVTQGLEAGNQQAAALRLVLDETRTRVTELSETQRELLALRQEVAANAQAIQAARGGVDNAMQAVETARGDLQQRLDEVTGRLSALDAARERGVGLAIAADTLDGALATGEPFAPTVNLVEQLGQGDGGLGEIVGRLRPVAASGVATMAELAGRLDEIERSLAPASQAAPGDWVAQMRENLSGLVTVQPVGGEAVPGQRAVRTARQALLDQDLGGAVAALTPLAEQGNQAAAAWVDAARKRLEAQAAVEALRSQVKTLLVRQG